MALPRLSKLEMQIMEALWTPGSMLHPRDSGSVSRAGQAGIHNRSDHRIPAGRKEGGAACQKDQ